MPDIFYSKLDEVPEGLREDAKETGDGKIVVKVAPQKKLEEFRDNNIALKQERDNLTSALGRAKKILGTEDFDEAERSFTDLRTTAKKVADGELIAKHGLDEAVATRTSEMRKSHDDALKAANGETQAWKKRFDEVDTRYKRSVIEREVANVALDEKLGVEPRALTDILNRAYGIFRVGDDGKIRAFSGEQELFGEDSGPMPVSEWVKKLREEAPHYFKGSRGGGATGGGGGGDTRFGMSASEWDKLSPEKRIELHNSRS